jgi:hypothetical protein
MIYLKINKTEFSEIVAICDEELIGKTFIENDLKLDITERFYKGKLMKEDEIVDILKHAKNINIIGKNAVNLAIKNNIIEKENIIKIKKIPHAIIFGI